MIRQIGFAAALLLLLPPAAGAASPSRPRAAAALARAASDLPADPAVRRGVLPNGMHYEIMRNATPPHAASLRLRIDAGSLLEREDQRGLAHFIEHMVLNGTRHVAEDEFVKTLERAGLKFGPDTNATTDTNQTVYMLELPESDDKTVGTALFLLREVAGEALFAADAIDRERGVVLSEERTRATPAYRAYVDQLSWLFAGDLLPERLPIGLPDVLRTAPRDRFVDFYDSYYRPERATLIAVGDFDLDAMEAKIRAGFGDWSARGRPGPALAPARIAKRGASAHVHVEPGLGTQVSLNWLRPYDTRPDTRAVETERMIETLGLRILNRRLEKIAATAAKPPFIGAQAIRGEPSQRAELTTIAAAAQPGQWQAALAAIVAEQRKVERFGFAQSELDREVTQVRAALAAAAAGAATRTNPALAAGLLKALNDDDVFTTPAFDLSLFDDIARGLKADRVAAVTRRLFAGSGPLVTLTAPSAVPGGDQALLAAFRAAEKAPIAADAAEQAKSWPYDHFGTPGTVAERRELAGLGATAIRFANGVRLTVKPTDFRKDQILVSVRIGDGLLDLPPDRNNPSWALGGGAYTLGGTGKLSYEELQQVLSSRVYGLGYGMADDAFTLSGATRPGDLAVQLQVLAAYVVDPGWRPSGWDRLRAYSPTLHDQLASTPAGVFSRDAGALLHSGDRRWATPSREEMAASRVADGAALLGPSLKSGPIEIDMVGDVTVDEANRQVAATFGALPPRGGPLYAPSALTTAFPPSDLVKLTHKGRADQGLAYIAWPTTGFYADQRRTRILNILGEVLELRLIDEIREKQGTTYSPQAGHSASQTFPTYGMLSAQIEAPPEKLDAFLADAAKIAASLREAPVSDDELERARKPLIETIQRAKAGNEWWLAQLANAQTNPGVGESILQGVDQYRSITPADLQQAAKAYLVDSKAWKLEVVPEAPAGK